jgi:hypothetical protein
MHVSGRALRAREKQGINHLLLGDRPSF